MPRVVPRRARRLNLPSSGTANFGCALLPTLLNSDLLDQPQHVWFVHIVELPLVFFFQPLRKNSAEIKLASRSDKSRPVRSRNFTNALCDNPKTTALPSTKNFVSIVSACRVAIPFHM